MKEKFIQIPQALRKQIWLRCGGAGMGAAMLLMVLIYSTDWRFMVPCAVAAALCIASAALLYYRCIQGRYLSNFIKNGRCNLKGRFLVVHDKSPHTNYIISSLIYQL